MALFLLVFTTLSNVHAWELALAGWKYEFPRDHMVHREFRTEWWYFTGNLRTKDGREFGFQVTFFRQGINERKPDSDFGVRDLSFAHAAISDIGARKFHSDQVTSRGSFEEAGFGDVEKVAWIKDWTLRLNPDGAWEFRASPTGQGIHLTAAPLKEPVVQGENGVSQKASGEGQASHYYSQTRLKTTGEIVLDGKAIAVEGECWFDHEWATNQLAEDQIGWNWFGLQFDDGSELMLYQMRRKDGSVDPVSSGTFIPKTGKSIHLRNIDFEAKPGKFTWISPSTKAVYPLDWHVSIPSLGLAVNTRARLSDQEMFFSPITYWEGAVRIEGSQTGRGYVELTGYGNALRALQSSR
ncbi:MAG TPA: lipocalin-like domain-containing protein [Chthoniobacterales bacterium]